jgi:uncharacterized protein YkwD
MSGRKGLTITSVALLFLTGCTGIEAQTTAANTTFPGIGARPPTQTTTSSPTDPSGAVTLDSEEAAFVTLINAYRVQNGLGALKVSVTLTESSKWLSVDMATKNYFSHTDSLGRDPFTRMAAFGYDVETAGENIAAGNATAEDTFTQWKDSPAHNANMLDAAYAVIGVGRAEGASSDYSWYWTTDFGSVIDTTF